VADFGLGSWPRRRARIDPDRPAFRQGDRELTYRQLADRVEALAGALHAAGVRTGDRVAYLAANSIAGFETLFAAGRLGAIFAPLNTRLTTPELTFLIDDCAPTVLVHDRDIGALIGPGSSIRRPIALADDYEAFLRAGHDQPPPETEIGLDDDAVILYTSGTTGRPKGAVLTHGNLTFNTMNQLAHADVLQTDTALAIAPLFHASGLGQVSLPTLFKGGRVAVLPRFDPAAVLEAIQTLRIASFGAVPTMLQILCDHPAFPGTDLSSLRYVIYGGSMATERVAVAWQRRGVAILQGYGMTEASPGVHLATPDGATARPTSIGTPHFFTDVKLRPLDDESTQSGELLVSGLNVFRGYWNRPEETAAALQDGWFHSGDVVRADDDGWAYVVDRIKDMIISGGENIYPAEVESQINSLPGVIESAVIAVLDDRWGEVGLAFIVPAPEVAQPWDATTLRDALTGRLAAYKIPKHVREVESLPKTVTGKIRKQDLRQAAATPIAPPSD
jgi:fatty-acyl-CoA synthase